MGKPRLTAPNLLDGPKDEYAKPKIGYHKREISKGILGTVSKIKEEYEEFIDAFEQDNPVMALHELSDLLGAIEAWTQRQYNIKLKHLIEMQKATKRAFDSGHRK